jgi:hypothetical protein
VGIFLLTGVPMKRRVIEKKSQTEYEFSIDSMPSTELR